jgi:hypothetical protein
MHHRMLDLECYSFVEEDTQVVAALASKTGGGSRYSDAVRRH